jgi:tetratricopeptide (TPR) repeat protein
MLLALAMFFFAAADGVTLYQQRQFAAAESEFRRMLAIRPADAQSRLYLARTLLELGRVPEALVEINRALAARTDPEIQFQAGSIIRELAEQRFADLERLAPDSAAVRELAGRHFEQRGNLPEALREYRAAIAKEPGRLGLHYEAGNILWRMRQLDAATEELQAELARSPHHGMANFRLGQVFLAGNDAARAVAFLEQAVDAMPEFADARRELGKAYRSLGRTADARTQWEAVAKARPDDDQVHYLLGNLYRQSGDADRARQELSLHSDILKRRQKRE